MVTYQAWSDKKHPDYKNEWDCGHYSVVKGMDAKNVYFEDPSSLGTRDYLPRQEFLDRWHDTDRHQRKLRNLGIVFTRPGFDPVRKRTPKLSKIG